MALGQGEQTANKQSVASASASSELLETNPNLLPPNSLLKGGGAVRGIGEKFAINPVTRTGSMIVPIVTSPGRSSFRPQLSLSYDSGAGSGPQLIAENPLIFPHPLFLSGESEKPK